jgi:hypothetical protein
MGIRNQESFMQSSLHDSECLVPDYFLHSSAPYLAESSRSSSMRSN